MKYSVEKTALENVSRSHRFKNTQESNKLTLDGHVPGI
jgi:hypothetical protein